MSYIFTASWFNRSEIQKNLKKLIDKEQELHFLEIGSYEGRSSCYFLDTFMNNEKSTLTCVDPFDSNDTTTPVTNEIETRFLDNIKKSKNGNKCTLHKLYSDDFFKINKNTYDVIYIDGSHIPENVIKDMTNSLKILKNNGIMWMDDYKSSALLIKTMDDFVNEHKTEVDVILKGYQLALRKIK